MRALFALILSFLLISPSYCAISGGVQKRDSNSEKTSKIIDESTGEGVPQASVRLPAKNYATQTDSQGRFELGTKINAPTIMSVQKDGYKPFSVTLQDGSNVTPIVVGIEKTNPMDVIVETNMIHLGDDIFSENSANASDFAALSVGPFYTKKFKVKPIKPSEEAYLIIGSIIGVDTIMAINIGQSNVKTTYASPPKVYCNGNQIAEIQINGDGQAIKIPKQLLRIGQNNDITIKAGKNLAQKAYIDYDDIEFTNLIIEVK